MVKSELKFFSAVLFVFFVSAKLWAYDRVISPASGTWNNKQCLVIDNFDGAECFYSLSGSDPLTSGFVYDGPILIDETGQVKVRIAAVTDERTEEYEIDYTVSDSNAGFSPDSEEYNFVASFFDSPLVLYTAEDEIKIPSDFLYSLSDEKAPSFQGKNLSLDSSNRLSRYVPCIVSNKNLRWRFIIFVAGSETGLLTRQTVPFSIEDWNTVRFNGEKLIWCIDDGMWSASTEPVYIDRDTEHVIKWQSIAYEEGNPVQSYVIPPKPSLITSSNSYNTKSVLFSIDGDMRYRMEIVSSGLAGQSKDNEGLFTQLVFDVFEGENVNSKADFAIYCDGVYNGTLQTDFIIDKTPPSSPLFVPSVKGMVVRNSVDVSIRGQDGADIYYAVSNGFEITSDTDESSYKNLQTGDYRLYDGRVITLACDEDVPLFYRITAYAKNKSDSISSISTYDVIIDANNYYVAENSNSTFCDGSKEHPYNDLDEVLSFVKNAKFARIYISGTVKFSQKDVLLNSNITLKSFNNGRLVLSPNSYICINDASVELEGLTVERENYSGRSSSAGQMFIVENAVLTVNNCEIVGIFDDSGSVFTSSGSVISVENSGITVKADNYACCVSAIDSQLNVLNSRFSAVAYTAVNFSISGGTSEIKSSSCKVVSHLGRVAELTKSNIKLSLNSFSGEFDKKIKGLNPIWKDDDTLVLENSNNTIIGF